MAEHPTAGRACAHNVGAAAASTSSSHLSPVGDAGIWANSKAPPLEEFLASDAGKQWLAENNIKPCHAGQITWTQWLGTPRGVEWLRDHKNDMPAKGSWQTWLDGDGKKFLTGKFVIV